MMDAAVAPFEALVRGVTLNAPHRHIVSTLTGRMLSAAEATDPAYWARHLREAVRFSGAIRTAQAEFAQPLFIELGPRATLATLARQHAGRDGAPVAVSLLADTPAMELVAFQLGLGRLWTLGVEVDLDDQSQVPLDDETGRKVLRLVDALEDSDDVQNVWANFDVSDEVFESV